MCCIYSLVLGTLNEDCELKAIEILGFFPPKSNLVTLSLTFYY